MTTDAPRAAIVRPPSDAFARALSSAGAAGPSMGAPKDEIGTMYCGLAGPNGFSAVEKNAFVGDRDRIRRFTAHAAMDLLRRTLR